ncbi:BID domain-containing T4SS effector [Bartonella tribocorum]|uniref:BepH protein n=1 Tax=Bartonella tribocorum TaxID=85701 RepID=A0A2M6US75_9HYPH|nr:BID domain-containing T4SS effector [Bartonella tribocorum]PIT69017.1 BepH protein [Bartonella tribocorum]
MKKSHPQNQEPVYAQVNKQNRGNQRRPNQEEELVYATVSSVDSPSRGRHHNQRLQETETDYTEVAPSKRQEEVLYASVNSVSPSRGRHHGQRSEGPETDYAELAPQQRGSSSLTAEQISVMLLKNPQVQARAEEVIHWSTTVYGKDNIFQKHLQDILTNPGKGKELSDKLAEDPESMHKLAGRTTLGIKNQTRREAENGFGPLINAIDDYTKAVQDATTRLSQTPIAEQRRHQENSREAERGHHHHHDHHHRHHRHERGQEQNSPEQSQHQRRHEQGKGMAYAM